MPSPEFHHFFFLKTRTPDESRVCNKLMIPKWASQGLHGYGGSCGGGGGGLMESLCLVEGVDAIPRPSGALSTVVNLPSFASKNFGDSWDSRTTSQNIVIQATKGDLALTLSSI